MARSGLASVLGLALVVLGGCTGSAGSTGLATSPGSPASDGSPAGGLASESAATPTPATPTPAMPSAGTTAPAKPDTSPTPGPEVAVACAAGAPTLSTDRVLASPDGVHFLVTGPAGWAFGVTTERGHDGVEISGGPASIVLVVPPGDVGISCADPSLPEIGPETPLVVEDPAGWYRPSEPGPAAGSCLTMDANVAAGARGTPGDPVALARLALANLRPGDIVERGGYPVESGTVRVVRAGTVIGRLTYDADGHGGWLLVGSTLCDGLRPADPVR